MDILQILLKRMKNIYYSTAWNLLSFFDSFLKKKSPISKTCNNMKLNK